MRPAARRPHALVRPAGTACVCAPPRRNPRAGTGERRPAARGDLRVRRREGGAARRGGGCAAPPEARCQTGRQMKYILVTGGVISGIGKGIIASSIGTILKSSGLRVTSIKIDPYINIDAGTFSPYEHGERRAGGSHRITESQSARLCPAPPPCRAELFLLPQNRDGCTEPSGRPPLRAQ